MKITIDGKEIEAKEGQSVLEAALAANVFIPHLCSHPDLEAKGGCRLCSVEIEGGSGAAPACETMAKDGMRIRVSGPEAEKVRKMAMELILATHPADCTGCPKYGRCELQSMYQYMGVSPERCQDLRGVKVLDYIKTDAGVRAGIPEGKSLKEAGCRFCGACIEVCPTGSIMDQVKIMKENRSMAENIVPCQSTCPAHIDIPRYIRYIREGDFDKAAAAANDSGAWKTRVRREPATGKKAAVMGAGPAGLTAAYYLAKKGHEVTVFEKNPKAGGQCRYGIPAYRLPDSLLDREIHTILEAGIELRTDTQPQSPDQLLKQGYDTVLVAVGTHKGTRLPIEGSSLPQVYVNTDFLKQARLGTPLPLSGRVMVLGGGNVAYDCARTALRLGAEEVHIACLENEQQMTSTPEEIAEGAEEGILLHAAHSFLRITGTDRVEGVELQKVNRFYFDENRKAVIELEEGTNQVIPVDYVIFAVGQKPEGTEQMGLELTHGPYILADANQRTSLEGVYAAGDAVTGTKSVIEAIAAGRRAAEQMDLYLGGDGDISEMLLEKETPPPYIGRMEDFAGRKRSQPRTAQPDQRVQDFTPVEEPFTCEQAMCEAARCLQCDLRLQFTKPKLWNEY